MTKPKMNESICRSCLEPTTKTYPLKGQLVNVEVEVVSMLEFCTSSKMDLSDDLPQGVCVACFKTIRIAYRFLKQFYEAQTKLISSRNKSSEQTRSDELETEFIVNTSEFGEHFLTIHDYTEHNTNGEQTVYEIRNSDENNSLIDIGQSDIHMNDRDEDNDEFYVNVDAHGMNDGQDEEIKIHFKNEDSISDEYSEDDSNDTKIKFEIIDSHGDNEESENVTVSKDEDSGFLQLLNLGDTDIDQSRIELVMDDSKDEDNDDKFLRYICPICDTRFCKAENFFTHVNKYNLSHITCPRCPTQPELEIKEYYRHYMEFHKYHCDICGRVMSSSYGYIYHMRHHKNVRNFKCPVKGCQRSFLMKHLLGKHIKGHSFKQEYSCHLCDSTFNTNDSLRYHLKLHIGQKDHLCTVCGRAFYQAVHLRDHMYRHIGYKKFVCDICGKGFITNGSLKKHISYCSRKHNTVT